MKAFRIVEPSGPRGLALAEVASPAFGADEVKVTVRATGLNRADLLQTMGLYPAPAGSPQDIPGVEFSGEVAAIGARVTKWKVGDRVMGLVGGGAWAEELVTHERELARVPSNLSFAEAAAIPEAFLTAWDALVTQAGLSLGAKVLIHAVASGVGTAAAQICREFQARAVGTGRNAAKVERAKGFGLAGTVVVKDPPVFAAEVLTLLPGGVDVALDLVGGDWTAQTLDAMAPRGTLMLVGLVAGASAELPLRTILGKRLRVIGTAMRSRALEEKIAVAQELDRRLVPLFEARRLAPVIDAVLPMAELAPALERVAKNDTFGKLVLTW
jgi:putative PIG3 family NAD(P)H quinone oxidoreductase